LLEKALQSALEGRTLQSGAMPDQMRG